MKMTCQRALEVLSSLGSHKPAFTADEIEELLGYGLALEADPRDMAVMQWLVPSVQALTELSIDNPDAVLKLGNRLAELTEQLRSDWYRFTHGKEKLAALEVERRDLRRAFAVLSEPLGRDRLFQLARQGRDNGDPTYAPCPGLGSELYALSRKGARAGNELLLRIARFAPQPLSAFMKAHDKVDAKMAAFSTDIATLSHNIGPVKKNPHQVVIGLAKTGLPADQALGVYRDALHRTGAASDAVTVARNASNGNTHDAAHRLKRAQRALRDTGLTMSDVALGCAKSLLGFDHPDAAAQRFVQIVQHLESNNLTRGDLSLKSAARLMPATGQPPAVARRTLIAYNQLSDPDRDTRTSTAVALASMVRDEHAIPEVVARFLALRDELLRRRLSLSNLATSDALECIGCPGTPQEVVDTVSSLVQKLANGRSARREDVAIAVAFAKRFAY